MKQQMLDRMANANPVNGSSRQLFLVSRSIFSASSTTAAAIALLRGSPDCFSSTVLRMCSAAAEILSSGRAFAASSRARRVDG